MSEEEFAVILTEIKELRRTIAHAVEHIARQESEIVGLQWFMEQKQLASAGELDAASEKGARLLESPGNVPEKPPSILEKHPRATQHLIAHSGSSRVTHGRCRHRANA